MSEGLSAKTSYLILLMGSLGDVARGLAVASALKKQQPDAKISWLVEPACADLVSCSPYVDQVIIFERSRGLSALLGLRRQLKLRHFDIALDLQRHFKSGLFSLLSGAKRRIGFHPSDCKEFNWAFNNEYLNKFGNGISKLEHYMLFVKKLELDAGPIDFGLSAFDAKAHSPAGFSLEHKYSVALLLGSRWESKNWPEEHYRKLLERILSGQNWQIILLGDRRQQQFADDLVQVAKSDRVLNLVGKTSLPQLMSVLKQVNCCLGPDSGPGHVAAALETPYISLFGPTSIRRVAPYRMEHLAISSNLACTPCQRKICPGLGGLCMKLLSADLAYSKLLECMSKSV